MSGGTEASSGSSVGRAIAFAGLDELQLVKIARERGLGDAHALLRETAAEVFLIGDPLRRDEAKDLAVTECFGGAHSSILTYTSDCIFIQSTKAECQTIFRANVKHDEAVLPPKHVRASKL